MRSLLIVACFLSCSSIFATKAEINKIPPFLDFDDPILLSIIRRVRSKPTLSTTAPVPSTSPVSPTLSTKPSVPSTSSVTPTLSTKPSVPSTSPKSPTLSTKPSMPSTSPKSPTLSTKPSVPSTSPKSPTMSTKPSVPSTSPKSPTLSTKPSMPSTSPKSPTLSTKPSVPSTSPKSPTLSTKPSVPSTSPKSPTLSTKASVPSTSSKSPTRAPVPPTTPVSPALSTPPPVLPTSSIPPTLPTVPPTAPPLNPTLPVTPTPCPPNKSLHTKEDINFIMDYRVETLSIYNSINNSYYSKAVEVRDKHMNDFKSFRSWYKNRPEHLKHTLEDIAFVRSHIELFARQTAGALQQYPNYQSEYNEKSNRTNKLLATLSRFKIICENNCESSDVFPLSRRSNFDGYYCSSIEELDKHIKLKLTEFVNITTATMLNQLKDDDKVFAEKIDELKNYLKDVALKEFGRNMYDTLNLQDEYHHFIEDVLKVDANAVLYKIRQTNFQIETKLLELEQLIQMYGTHCRTCNNISQRSLPKKINKRNTLQDKQGISKNIVDNLLNKKYEDIKNLTHNEYSKIFKELNSIINNTASMDIYLTDLKPIQSEVTEMVKEQRKNFEELKSITAPLAVKKLVKLSSDSKELLSKINAEIDNLHKKIPE